MNILVGYESSGTVREAFRKQGHNSYSCDIQPADDNNSNHIQCDIWDLLQGRIKDFPLSFWDMFIMHPTCTYLCSSGLHWNKKRPERQKKTEKSIQEFILLTEILKNKPFVIENPIGCMSKKYRKPDQIIQPYEFGDNASKATCLWLNKLPCLKPTKYIKPRVVIVNGKKYNRWDNQTDSGQNKLPPSKDRWKIRSKTYQGIANAMADQWNEITVNN